MKIIIKALLATFLLSACMSVDNTTIPETSVPTSTITLEPKATLSRSPTVLDEADALGHESSVREVPTLESETITLTPTPDACLKQTIPEILLSPSPDTNQKKPAVLGAGSPDNEGEIFITDSDGHIIRNITNHPPDDGIPKWSPDGKRIAFLSNRNWDRTTQCNGIDDCPIVYQLFSVNPDGTGLRQITKDWTYHYSWSPDGKQFVFLRAVKSDASPYPNDPFLYEIYAVNSDGTNMRNLTNFPGFYYEPAWSPDGTKIAFGSGDIAAYPNSLNIINGDGTGLSAYSDKKTDEFIWAPDGTSLIFVYGIYIYKLKIDSLTVEQLNSSPQPKDMLALSPDGKWLAYHSIDQCNQIRVTDIETGQDYFVYDARDVGNAELDINRGTIAPSYSPLGIVSIHWTPDGNQLIFNQMVTFDMIFGEFEETFSIQVDGTGLREFGDRSGYYSFQPGTP